MTRLLPAAIFLGVALATKAENFAEHYANYGQLTIVKLDSAPFPHPARANGHKYHDEFYSAETNYSDNSVGIFVPKGFRPTRRVDYVVHFYGWRHHIETTLSEYKLIEQFSASGRNAILIVPQGPYDAPDSFEGKFEDTNGFRRFMGDVVSTLQTRGVIRSGSIGEIILSGHSGGYRAMSAIVSCGGMSDSIKEVWLFDALYAGTENFVAWFNAYPNRRLIDIYTKDGGTKEETENLMALLKSAKPPKPFVSKNEADLQPSDLRNNRLIFIFSPLPHDEVVYGRSQYREFLETSSLPSIKTLTSPKHSGD